MKIIITESQSRILWLRRRLEDEKLQDDMEVIFFDIMDNIGACGYGKLIDYANEILILCKENFINQYDELGGYGDDYWKLERFVIDLFKKNYGKIIENSWNGRICDEDNDDDNWDY